MFRIIYHWILISFILLLHTACVTGKLKEQEFFLNPDSSPEKLYIISVIPLEIDSLSYYSSILLAKNTVQETQQLIAYSTFYNRTGISKTTSYFIDSVLPLYSDRFPLRFQPSSLDSSNASFAWALNRKSMEFSIFETSNETQMVTFERQSPFLTQNSNTAFGIHAILPIKSTLMLGNSNQLKQSSYFVLHSFDQTDSLYGKREQHYYWLDCAIENMVNSLFFKVDKSQNSTIIYSQGDSFKHPSFALKTENELTLMSMNILYHHQNESITVRYSPINQISEPSRKNAFQVHAVDLYLGEVLIGTGILYQL